ncbi:flagellar export chaperone FliS [Natroniella sp. ANB-PHB2]|uniref:flagellar export chaperone FliS n=1 Tax=Natroniella sp. ANB-PHB2 TaxID=3384444 RepID=UPI0038D513D3
MNKKLDNNISQAELLLMLYNGAIKFSQTAKEDFYQKKFEDANQKLNRVQAIINELSSTLDMENGGEIAENLNNLYEYMNRRLIQANIRKDTEIIEEVIGLLMDLKEGWEEAQEQLN